MRDSMVGPQRCLSDCPRTAGKLELFRTTSPVRVSHLDEKSPNRGSAAFG